jgi:hypothetical protein
MRRASPPSTDAGLSVCDGRSHLVRIPEGQPPLLVEAFQQHLEVEYAELNYYATASFVPDDTFFSYQWSFHDKGTGGIHMEEAWNITRGDPNVIVAIVDTGVAYEDYDIYRQAPDLAQHGLSRAMILSMMTTIPTMTTGTGRTSPAPSPRAPTTSWG